jgi:hypothetical protein
MPLFANLGSGALSLAPAGFAGERLKAQIHAALPSGNSGNYFGNFLKLRQQLVIRAMTTFCHSSNPNARGKTR